MTIDKNRLKALAEATTKGRWCTDGGRQVMSAESDQLNSGFVIVDCQGPDNLQNADFIAAANPATILALLGEVNHLEQFKAAHLEWIEKTEWVQKSVKAPELGMHRADVINQRIEQLKVENEALRKDAERLDRLDKEGSGYGTHELEGYKWTVDGPFSSVREAIDCLFDYDEAMAKEKSHG